MPRSERLAQSSLDVAYLPASAVGDVGKMCFLIGAAVLARTGVSKHFDLCVSVLCLFSSVFAYLGISACRAEDPAFFLLLSQQMPSAREFVIILRA